MKSLLLTLVLGLGLAACSSSSDSKKDPVKTTEQTRDVTDYSICQQGRPASSIEGSWQQQQSSQNFDMVLTLQVSSGAVRITNDCSSHGHSARASVAVAADYTFNTLNIRGETQIQLTMMTALAIPWIAMWESKRKV